MKKKKDLKEENYNLILTKILNVLKNKKEISEEEKIKLKKAKNTFKDITFLPRRLFHKNSSFIEAAEKGGWVFFDGIEMGHSILFDTISSLCSENPQLNVLGSEKIIILDKNKISPKFKFFLSFDP